jgi:hypothetical protein
MDLQQWFLEKGFTTSILPENKIWDPEFIQSAGK